jgi:hypothetical protein
MRTLPHLRGHRFSAFNPFKLMCQIFGLALGVSVFLIVRGAPAAPWIAGFLRAHRLALLIGPALASVLLIVGCGVMIGNRQWSFRLFMAAGVSVALMLSVRLVDSVL